MDPKSQYTASHPQFVNGSYEQPVSSRRKLPPSRMWVVSRLLFSISSGIMAIITLGIGGGIANYRPSTGDELYDYILSHEHPNHVIPFLMTGPQAILALLWDVAEWITICVRQGHRGMHPGAHVGMNLVICIGLACGVGVLGGFQIPMDNDEDDGSYQASNGDVYIGVSGLVALEVALAGVAGVLAVIHFIWFILACFETSRINTATKEAAPLVITINPPAPQHNGGASTLPPPPQGYYYVPADMVGQIPLQQLQPQSQHGTPTPPAPGHSHHSYNAYASP